MCAEFICFLTNNSKNLSQSSALSSTEAGINLVMSSFLCSLFLRRPSAGMSAGLTQDQAKLRTGSSLQLQRKDLICLSNHLGNHRNWNFSTGSRFPTATSDQRHSKSSCGVAGRHLDSGLSPCSMTASVCTAQYELRHSETVLLKSTLSLREGKGREEGKMGGTARLNPPALSPCSLGAAIFHLVSAPLMPSSG